MDFPPTNTCHNLIQYDALFSLMCINYNGKPPSVWSFESCRRSISISCTGLAFKRDIHSWEPSSGEHYQKENNCGYIQKVKDHIYYCCHSGPAQAFPLLLVLMSSCSLQMIQSMQPLFMPVCFWVWRALILYGICEKNDINLRYYMRCLTQERFPPHYQKLSKYLPGREGGIPIGFTEMVRFPLAIRKFTRTVSRTLMPIRVKMTTQ